MANPVTPPTYELVPKISGSHDHSDSETESDDNLHIASLKGKRSAPTSSAVVPTSSAVASESRTMTDDSETEDVEVTSKPPSAKRPYKALLIHEAYGQRRPHEALLMHQATGCSEKMPNSPSERPDWLPEGWHMEVRPRNGNSFRVDKFYYHPYTKKQFRSKTEVLAYLQSGGERNPNNRIRRKPLRNVF